MSCTVILKIDAKLIYILLLNNKINYDQIVS